MGTEDRINDYANSMFRFEVFNEAWISDCTRYLNYLFKGSLQGRTVIDYAFGRGNWSLAFLRAGAKSVISIDASIDNVERFRSYCSQNGLDDIAVIHGNLLNQSFDFNADLVWMYGILHHIKDVDIFLEKSKSLLKGPDSQIYVYYYDRESVREFVVERCRQFYIYETEAKFLKDNYLFLRSAKNRAADDLVAPFIGWYTAKELQRRLNKNKFYVERQDIDFYEFTQGAKNQEFYPYQFLCGRHDHRQIDVANNVRPYDQELADLTKIADDVFKIHSDGDTHKKIAIGLFNTHFSSLKKSLVHESLVEIFLYFMRILVQAGGASNRTLSPLSQRYCRLTMQSVSGDKIEEDVSNLFVDYLRSNRLRL